MTYPLDFVGGTVVGASQMDVVEKKLNAYVDVVADFNAVGDGDADDGAKTLAAIAEVESAGGGMVLNPPNTILHCPNGISIPTKVKFVGAGRQISEIKVTAAAANAIRVTGHRAEVRGLKLRGVAGTGDGIVHDTAVGYFRASDLSISDFGGSGVHAPSTNFIHHYEDIELLRNDGRGFYMPIGAGSHNAITLIQVYANDNGLQGFQLSGGSGVVLVQCSADNNQGNAGFQWASCRVTFIECTAELNDTRGFYCVGSGRAVYVGCRTANQILPLDINGVGDNLIEGLDTHLTPSGPSIQVSATSTGDNVRIGGQLDSSMSVFAGGRLEERRKGAPHMAFDGYRIGSRSGPTWTSGTGSPEGVVTAPVSSLYSQADGGAGSALWAKESGTGNTGWVAK